MPRTLNSARITEGWGPQILLLTWAAGSMDALGYLGLDHVFTANMTGNTVLLGLATGRGEVLATLRSFSALLGFVAGVGAGAAAIQSQKPRVCGVAAASSLRATAMPRSSTMLWFVGASSCGFVR